MASTTTRPRGRRSSGRARVRLAGLFGVIALMLVAVSGVFAVHDKGFQLEGNQDSNDLNTGTTPATLTGAFAGPNDWFDSTPATGGADGIFKLDGTGAAVNNTPLPTGYIAAGFARDFRTTTKNGATVFDTSDGTTFTVGSKDTLDVNQWSCVGANNVTDKGDITNAYATMQIVGGHRLVYFALEKAAVQGDNNVGFWFLQNGASCPPDSTGNGTHFTGTHANGDVFVVSEFTNGGGISTIKAYVWNNGVLGPNPVASGVDCLNTNGNDAICATTNRLEITPAWPHVSKSGGLSGTVPVSAFFEGGVDLDARNTDGTPVFGFTSQCFADFLANTRSSQELGATLYDYALGSLTTCGSVTVKKITVPTPATATFPYTTTGGLGTGSFNLDTNASTVTPTDTKVFTGVPPGDYTVNEGSTTGWTLSNLVCTKNGTPFDQTTGQTTSGTLASFHVGFGDNIFCTYTNVKPAAKISISPTATNEVGQPHTFTVTVQEDTTGTGVFTAATVGNVDVSLTDSNGATSTINAAASTCDDAQPSGDNLDSNGQCILVINSTTAGKVTAHASATITVGSVTLTPATDGLNGNSGDAVKTYVDANITIAGNGTNKVGAAHTFTVTVQKNIGDGNGYVAADNGHVDVTLTDTLGAASVIDTTASSCDDAGDNLTAAGTCIIVFTSNSTGVVSGDATVTIPKAVFGTASDVVRDTKTSTASIGHGIGGSDTDAVKTWVDARITIGTSGTNPVNQAHTFTVTVQKDLGDGAGFVAASGLNVLASETGIGTITGGTCDNTGGDTDVNGKCTIIVNSSSAGSSTVNASTTVVAGGVSIPVATDGYGAYGISNTKNWVDASITISPDATNKVGDPHTFTVTVEADTGSGMAPVTVGNVDVTLTDSNGAVNSIDTALSTCDDNQPSGDNLDANGQCTIVFTSDSTGQVTGHATAAITVSGVAFTLATDGSGNNSGDAVKTFVDAQITIGTSGTNLVGHDHTFTVTVEKDLGDGNGFVAAAGETVATSLEAGSVGSITGGTCTTTVTDSSGQCTVIVHSTVTGTATVDASTTVTVGGVDIDVATNGYGKHDISNVKTWVDGSLTWIKHDNNGQLLGGATFQVCRTFDRFGTDIPDECVTVLDNSTLDVNKTDGLFELDHLLLGRYTITETVAPPTYNLDPFVDTVELTLASPNGAAVHVWVDTPAGEGCTPGFWAGGVGVNLWNTSPDPQWTAAGGVGNPPFIESTLFNSFFEPNSSLAGMTMLDIVGTGGGSNPAQKAARDVIAAYLNASFGLNYPYTTSQIAAMWAAANPSSSALNTLHNLLAPANQLGCKL